MSIVANEYLHIKIKVLSFDQSTNPRVKLWFAIESIQTFSVMFRLLSFDYVPRTTF